MKQKRYGAIEILVGCISFLLLFFLAIKVWRIILAGLTGRIIFILLLIFLAGLAIDYFFATGLFLSNE